MAHPGYVIERTPLVLRLEIEHTRELIDGQVSDGSGTVVAFTGWIAFAAAIEAFMGPTSLAPAPELPTERYEMGDDTVRP